MFRQRVIVAIACAAAAAIGLSACGSPSPGAEPQQDFKVAGVLPLTGAFGPVGTYFAHRWSDPTFLSGLALAQSYWGAPRRVLEVACGAGHYLRAFAGLELDAMDRRAHRDVAHRQGVARADRRFGAGQDPAYKPTHHHPRRLGPREGRSARTAFTSGQHVPDLMVRTAHAWLPQSPNWCGGRPWAAPPPLTTTARLPMSSRRRAMAATLPGWFARGSDARNARPA